MGDLSLEDYGQVGHGYTNGGAAASANEHARHFIAVEDNKKQQISIPPPPTSSQLTLSIRAQQSCGISVALSGASGILTTMPTDPLVKSTVKALLEATSNPFALSASDALLAATKLCSEQKCVAVVQALQEQQQQHNMANSLLPDWITLSIEHGTIAVSTSIHYHRGLSQPQPLSPTEESFKHSCNNNPFPILFRLVCDARTGSFIPTFPRSLHLLRRLACNDAQASEPAAIRAAASIPTNRPTRTLATSSTTTSNTTSNYYTHSSFSSGRTVRDAFDGLIRSMNVLAYRVGLGGDWVNHDDYVVNMASHQLRQKAVQSACVDVRTSLIKCCALSSLYGLCPLACSIAFGLAATPDL
jgi:hypothetical protein